MKSTFPLLTSICIILLSSCQVSETQRPPFPEFSYEGHRGARGLYPENTIHGMYTALDLGVTTLEMDVHITKDGQVVLSHDAYLNPKFVLAPSGEELSDRSHLIYQMDYDSLKLFDTGSKDHPDFPQQVNTKEHIPLLGALIDSVEHYAAKHKLASPYYNIETKSKDGNDGIHHPDPKTFVDLLVKVIEQKKVAERVIIQSFDPRTLQVLHRDYPNIRTSYLTSDKTKTVEDNISELGFTPYIYSPNFQLVDQGLVDKCREMGLKIIPWTANTAEEIERLKSLRVDGIITDYPNLFNLK